MIRYKWLNGKPTLSRDDIKTLAEACKSSEQLWPTLFTISMLWGYGENDDSGPVKLFYALNTKNAEGIIQSTADYVASGRLTDAFVTIRGLKEIGASYGTKYLFAVGRAYRLSPEPLVLDGKLVKALRNWWGGNEADQRFNLGAKDYSYPKGIERAAKGYVAYCEELQRIAGQLGPAYSPDMVEQFLFENPNPL